MAGGRPTKYLPVYARMARKFGRRGFTRAEIAGLLEVSTMTLWRWESAYPEFREAIRAGAAPADERVERSLYERAVGYTFESEKVFCSEGAVVRAPVLEHVPPDIRAIELWLMNRKPQVWRPRRAVEEAPPAIEVHFHDPTAVPSGYARRRLPATIEADPQASAA